MLSIIIQEHNEPAEFVRKMVAQAEKIDINKEIIFVTSSSKKELEKKIGNTFYDLNIKIIPNIDSCGKARNIGGKEAIGTHFLYLDNHTCFSPETIEKMLNIYNYNTKAVVGAGIRWIDFPSCMAEKGVGIGYGLNFRFEKDIFEWNWLPPTHTDQPFYVPFVDGCAFMIDRHSFNELQSWGGWFEDHEGLGVEEEITMRLWRRCILMYLMTSYIIA